MWSRRSPSDPPLRRHFVFAHRGLVRTNSRSLEATSVTSAKDQWAVRRPQTLHRLGLYVRVSSCVNRRLSSGSYGHIPGPYSSTATDPTRTLVLVPGHRRAWKPKRVRKMTRTTLGTRRVGQMSHPSLVWTARRTPVPSPLLPTQPSPSTSSASRPSRRQRAVDDP